MPSAIRIVSIKSGMPTVEEARARLKVELDRARSEGSLVLKLIHGYGSSGVGGTLRRGVRASLRKRLKEGQIRAFVPGEQWDIFNEAARRILEECPELASDQDLNHYNEGITLVLL
ncbi:MAG TPA: Smr/MutS family protein [Phycisphaerae bacterium]|nr:Smr/MutS family protein [Phycisphaerae bacterium]